MGMHDVGPFLTKNAVQGAYGFQVGKGGSEAAASFAEEGWQALHGAANAMDAHAVIHFALWISFVPEGGDRDGVSARGQGEAEVTDVAFFAADGGWVELGEHQDAHGCLLARIVV